MISSSNFLRRFFPHYDELTLFIFGLVVVLTVLANLPPNLKLTTSNTDPALIPVGLVILAGLFLSLYHTIVSRRKSLLEKKLMLVFAVIVNAFAGIWGGTYSLSYAHGWVLIFPIWNILNSFFLLQMLREGLVDESCVSDDNVNFYELVTGVSIALVIYCICHYGFKFNWAATFSMCVAYATNFNTSLVQLFFRKSNSARQTETAPKKHRS